ncbi:MAG: hypothetical protein ACI4TV_00850, partial [Paludibacteraceae bacterium]
LPPMIFFMLFFTFCKVNPLDLRLHRWHWIVLFVQLAIAVGLYYGIMAFEKTGSGIEGLDITAIAQGLMICVLMPTATAAPIIAGKMGGSIQNLTTFTMLSNIATAIIVPAFFPIVNPMADMTFWHASGLILGKVGPLLLGPFLAAWLLRLCYDGWQRHKGSTKRFALTKAWVSVPFYLWAGTLIILMADITHSMLTTHFNGWTLVFLFGGALLTCLLQFFLGKTIGHHFPAPSKGEDYRAEVIRDDLPTDMPFVSRVTAGQAFGQKNTTLGVWMAQTYLCPLAALGPAAYIIWQNIFNSIQLLVLGRDKKKAHSTKADKQR